MRLLRVTRSIRFGAIIVGGFVVIVGIALVIVGVPAPPAITATGVPRIPWTPMVEVGSYVKHMLVGQTLVNWHLSGEGLVI